MSNGRRDRRQMAASQDDLRRQAERLLAAANTVPGVGAREFAIEIKGHNGPNATPLSLIRERADGVEITVYGGLMKDELLAAPVAAMLSLTLGMTVEETCDKALDLAEVLLARAAARRKAKAPPVEEVQQVE